MAKKARLTDVVDGRLQRHGMEVSGRSCDGLRLWGRGIGHRGNRGREERRGGCFVLPRRLGGVRSRWWWWWWCRGRGQIRGVGSSAGCWRLRWLRLQQLLLWRGLVLLIEIVQLAIKVHRGRGIYRGVRVFMIRFGNIR